MSELDDLQTWLSGLLVEPRAFLDERTAERRLSKNGRLKPLEQIEVYREQFWLRHTAALLEDFPGLSRLLGQGDWQAFAEDYLRHYPPASPLLGDLGHGVAAHLRDPAVRSRFGNDERPADLLEDMARLEWAYLECFTAADGTPLDVSRLDDDFDWDDAALGLSPAVRLLDLRYPVTDLRRRLLSGAKLGELAPIRQRVLVHRGSDGALWDLVLPGPVFALLTRLETGTPLAAACQQVVDDDPSAAAFFDAELGSWFARLGGLGLIGAATPASIHLISR